VGLARGAGIGHGDGDVHLGRRLFLRLALGLVAVKGIGAQAYPNREICHLPRLGQVARQIGDVQVRNKGTIGGSIVHADPAADRAANNGLVSLAHSVAWGTSSIALLIGILGIANTMAMSVFERTREIGILRALGWKGGHVILLILTEATALGLVGGLLGIAAGWGGLRLLAALPQTASVASATISPLHLLESLLVAIASGVLAGAYPAWRGAHLSPVEALRYE